MTEQEKLKRICDEIGYEPQKPIELFNSRNWDFYWKVIKLQDSYWYHFETVNPREIIFTPQFKEKYIKYEIKNIDCPDGSRYWYVLLYLDNPVEYLYNEIFPTQVGNKQEEK